MKFIVALLALGVSAFAGQVKMVAEVETWYSVDSTPLVVGDKVYVGTSVSNKGGALIILNEDGQILRTAELDSIPSSPALLSNNTIAVGGYRCVYLLDLKGRLIKKIKTHAQNYSFGRDRVLPLASGFVVAGGTGAGVPIGFYSNDGEFLKSYSSESVTGWGNPVQLSDGTIVISAGTHDNSDNLHFFSQKGEKLKSLKVGHRWSSEPLVFADGSMVTWAGVANPSDKARAELFFVGADGKIKWSMTSKYLTESPPALSRDNRIVTAIDGMLYLLALDGRSSTQFSGNKALGYSPPAVMTDGTIVMSSAPSQANLYFVTPEGQELAHFDLEGRYVKTPAVFTPNGNIVVGTSASWSDGHGRIYFLKLTE